MVMRQLAPHRRQPRLVGVAIGQHPVFKAVQLAADPARASALGAAGSRYADDVLCEAAVLANYERLFQAVIASHQSANIPQFARVRGAS